MGWDYGMPVVSMLKVSSQGLRGSDFDSLVKRAGHHFADKFRDFKCAKDQIPLHVIAMGATEKWGPNRNGDGFTEHALKKYGHTFISKPLSKQGAYWYKNHQNKDYRKSYGIVKDAWYNPEMCRQELIVLLNGEKSAADRNGFGFVDNDALDKIARGDDIPVSMACRVPFDKCAYCQNQARTRADYCTAETCKAGGMREKLAQVVKIGNDLFHNYVDNPSPNFFDISKVFRGADRTAFAGPADYIQKAAFADGHLPGGAELAELLGVEAPFKVALDTDTAYITNDRIRNQVKLAYGLAQLEMQRQEHNERTKRAFDSRLQPPFDFSAIKTANQVPEALAALADQCIVMKLADFARLTGRIKTSSHATQLLPGVFTRLTQTGDIVGALESNPYAPSDNYPSDRLRTWAKHAAETYSLDPEFIGRRAMRSEIRSYESPSVNVQEKVAWDGNDPEAAKLATDYALYQVSALSRIAALGGNFPLTVAHSVAQNYVS
jgi:hypothetical protein